MATQSAPLSSTSSHRWTARALSPALLWEQCSVAAFRLGAVVLLSCLAVFVWQARGWPLVNDAALMHYVVFLTGKGLAPYRQIGDYNLPGSYAPEWMSMWLAGAVHGSAQLFWRVFDLGAMAGCIAAMISIGRRTGWFAGLWAGSLFALLHARDGIGQAGQRDLWMTMLLLCGVALLFRALRYTGSRVEPLCVGGFGFCIAAAATIKPQAVLWFLCMAAFLHAGVRHRMRLLAACVGGAMLPVVAVLLYLWRYHAMAAFWHILWVTLPYHIGLARQSLWQLSIASVIPSIFKLSLLGAAAWLAMRRGAARSAGGALPRLELRLLLLCTALGFASFYLQGKGYTYQRYPFLAFLFLTVGMVLANAMRARRWLPRALGMAGLAFGVLFCAPSYLRAACRAHWPTNALTQMETSIRAAAGPTGVRSLDGRVQCIDTVSGCTDALLALRLRPATGLLYDELLFPESLTGVPGDAAPVAAVVQQARAQFAAALVQRPPRVILLSAWLFPEGPGNYTELASWPWLAQMLATRYTLVSEQSFPRAENGPLGFRVYVLRSVNNATAPHS